MITPVMRKEMELIEAKGNEVLASVCKQYPGHTITCVVKRKTVAKMSGDLQVKAVLDRIERNRAYANRYYHNVVKPARAAARAAAKSTSI